MKTVRDKESVRMEHEASSAGNWNFLFDATYCPHVPWSEMSKTFRFWHSIEAFQQDRIIGYTAAKLLKSINLGDG